MVVIDHHSLLSISVDRVIPPQHQGFLEKWEATGTWWTLRKTVLGSPWKLQMFGNFQGGTVAIRCWMQGLSWTLRRRTPQSHPKGRPEGCRFLWRKVQFQRDIHMNWWIATFCSKSLMIFQRCESDSLQFFQKADSMSSKWSARPLEMEDLGPQFPWQVGHDGRVSRRQCRWFLC